MYEFMEALRADDVLGPILSAPKACRSVRMNCANGTLHTAVWTGNGFGMRRPVALFFYVSFHVSLATISGAWLKCGQNCYTSP